jgi:endonuclease YncB( thermonuclease family)
MKNFKLSLLICLTLTLAFSAFSQRRVGGKVVEVIDGKTAVVQMSNGGKLTVVLQYIEIPEPDQPLYSTVKDHLQKLILDKYVDVNPRGIKDSQTIGQISMRGVDISQQMIRDGAAWHADLQSGGQNPGESSIYQNQQELAKTEKRGVWSVDGMKPAWEFRAAKEEARLAAERAEWEAIKTENQARQIAEAEAKRKERENKLAAARNRNTNFGASGFDNFDTKMWTNIGATGLTDANGLIINRFPQYNAEVIITSPEMLDLSSGKKKQAIECQFGYVTYKPENGDAKEFFGFACKSESDTETFKKSNQLTIIADGKKVSVVKAVQLGAQGDQRFNELIIYDIDRDFVVKIAQADKVQVKVGEFSGTMSDKLHTMTKSMILEIDK